MSYQDDIIYHKVLMENQKNRIYAETVQSILMLSPDIKILVAGANSGNIDDVVLKIQKEVDKAFKELYHDSESQLKAIASYEADFQKAIIANSVAYGNKDNVVKVSKALLNQSVFKDPIEGLSFIDNLSVINQSLKKETEKTVRSGILNGLPVREIQANIQRNVNTSSSNYNSFIRTAVQNVNNKATELTYEENEDFIEFIQYVAILDKRTTKICKDLNGNIYAINEGPRPPQHWNCRSFTIPIFENGDEIDKTYADWKEGENADIEEIDEDGFYSNKNKKITIKQQRKIESERLNRSV